MYITLFNAQTNAISLLQQAQRETEDMYIEAKEPVIELYKPENDEKSEDEK